LFEGEECRGFVVYVSEEEEKTRRERRAKRLRYIQYLKLKKEFDKPD